MKTRFTVEYWEHRAESVNNEIRNELEYIKETVNSMNECGENYRTLMHLAEGLARLETKKQKIDLVLDLLRDMEREDEDEL